MKFSCLHCGQRYEIDDRFAGRSTPCQTCGNIMKIPVPIGNAVTVRDEVLHITSKEIEHRTRRRRKHRWMRRVIIAAVVLLLGMILGAIAMIVIETRDPHLYSTITGESEEDAIAPPPAL